MLSWDWVGSVVIVPETLGGCPVTAVAAPAFCGDNWDKQDNNAITSIALPGVLTRIGSYCFYFCESLESIILPDGLQSIGEYAFSNCKSLTEMTIPDSVTDIGHGCFDSCADGFTIVCSEGSVADICASDNDIAIRRP